MWRHHLRSATAAVSLLLLAQSVAAGAESLATETEQRAAAGAARVGAGIEQDLVPPPLLARPAPETSNRFWFTGHEHDPATGLIYAGARYYDPSIGRFISADPFPGFADVPASLNKYLYAHGNPTVYVDPDGRLAIVPILLAGALGAEIGFFADLIVQEIEHGATDIGSFLRNDYDPVRGVLSTAAGAVSGGVGGGLAQAGVRTSVAVATSLTVDSALDTGIEIATLEPGQRPDLARRFGTNLAVNTAMLGVATGAARLLPSRAGATTLIEESTSGPGTGSFSQSSFAAPAAVDEVSQVLGSRPALSIAQARALPQPHRGVILVREPPLPPTASAARRVAADFESGTHGTLSDPATRERIVPAIRFDNPNPAGSNFVKLDGLESATRLIDAKTRLLVINQRTGQFIPQSGDLLRLSEAARQNANLEVILEFPNQAALAQARQILARLRITNITLRLRGQS